MRHTFEAMGARIVPCPVGPHGVDIDRHAAALDGVRLVNLSPSFQFPTGVVMPEGHDADHLRKVVLDNFDMSLGTGLNKIKGRVFRVGHIGHFNDLMLMGTLSGVEMGLELARVPHRKGGVLAAMEVLTSARSLPMPQAAVA